MATNKANGTASGTPSGPASEAAGAQTVAVATLAEEATSELLPQAEGEARATGLRGESEEAEGTRTRRAAAVPTGSPATSTGEAFAPGAAGVTSGSEARVETEAASKAEAEVESKAQAETETESEAEAESEAGAKAEAKAEAKAGAEATGKPSTGTGERAGHTAPRPLGRPTKPMMAAAVVGGLLLIGIPFLFSGPSGPDGTPPSASGQGPSGSLIGPDGSGPGVVPGQQNAPDSGRVGSSAPGKPNGGAAGGSAAPKGGPAGGLHEGGTASHDGSGNTRPLPGGTGAQGNGGQPAGGGTTPTQNPTDSGGTSGGAVPQGKDTVQQPAPVTYTHFIGPGCDTPGFATSDRYTDGTKGWLGSWGSQKGYGCSGLFYSLPLSNSTSKSTGAYAHWRFPTGKVTKGSCAVEVYIPNVKDLAYVGGSPAHYTVYRSFQPQSSTKVGTFEINQAARLGQWVAAGSYRVDQGRLSVILDNRGTTSGNRHAAAAPVRISCSA
ncbi:hypothetical protein ACF09C_30035 [Streptomyces sp. NPDC014870]|uniref:hypothetical protein n=1 Tax=Streptomyces sp. NPDC014870 TaxID=3364925 RepID=UPI0037000E0D